MAKNIVEKPLFIWSEKYENDLKQTMDGLDTPIFFYDLDQHLLPDENDDNGGIYQDDWGFGFPSFLISPVKMTNDEITRLWAAKFRSRYVGRFGGRLDGDDETAGAQGTAASAQA